MIDIIMIMITIVMNMLIMRIMMMPFFEKASISLIITTRCTRKGHTSAKAIGYLMQ